MILKIVFHAFQPDLIDIGLAASTLVAPVCPTLSTLLRLSQLILELSHPAPSNGLVTFSTPFTSHITLYNPHSVFLNNSIVHF